MRGLTTAAIIGAAACTFASIPEASAQDISAELFATGFNKPVFVTHAPGDFDRVFVVEQDGRVRIIENGVVLPTPFLAIEGLVYGQGDPGWFNEQGLLGLAFHPDFQNNGKFYVNYTAQSNDDTVVTEYTVSAGDPNLADLASGRQIIRFSQDFVNHNGGWIGFSPNDGYLYIATGDGGSGNDPFNNAQNLNEYLGKMLRIDVDADDFPSAAANYAIPDSNPFVGTAGVHEEIWAYGLRNPFRCSFDRDTADLWIGDVGQGSREEVDVQPANSLGGENYGWRCMEGTECTGLTGCTCFSVALTDPIHDYSQAGTPCSVISGYRYRGCMIPGLDGTYFFTDYCSTVIQTFVPNASLDSFTNFTDRTAQLEPAGSPTISLISSFGEDAYGELYICDLADGEIYKIVPTDPTPRTDCNMNGIEDACEILDGRADDVNGNGIPDECEVGPCFYDVNNTGTVDIVDFTTFAMAFDSMTGDPNFDPALDFNNTGSIDIVDFTQFSMEFNRDDCPTD